MSDPQEPPLRRPGFHSPRPDGLLDSAFSKKAFTPENCDEFDEHIRVVFDVQPVAFAYAVVEANYEAIGNSLASHQQRYTDVLRDGLDPVREGCLSLITLTKSVSNFLSSTSAFLDQTNRRLILDHGKGTPQHKEWTELRRAAYDASFSYRFMYHLRHYAQHHSIPLNNLQVKANRDDPSSPWQFEISLSTLRDGLLKDGFDWKQARDGIESQSEIFDLQPLVAEYVNLLGVLCREYLESHQQRLEECGRYLGAYVRVFKIPSKSWPVIFVGESQVAGCPPGQVEWVPIGQYQFITELLARLPKGSIVP